MHDELESVKIAFSDTILKNIDNAFANGAELAAFMLVLSALDCLAVFFSGEAASATNLRNFTSKHASLGRYDAERLYTHARSGLVHNFTIKQNAYILIWNKPHWHLHAAQDGSILLNFEDFYADFRAALADYFSHVATSTRLRHILVKRYRADKIIGPRSIENAGGHSSGYSTGFQTHETFVGYGAHTTTALVIQAEPSKEG